MNKYKVGDKVVMEITDKISVMGEPWYVLSEATSIFETYLDKDAEPLTTYTKPLETKIHRQATEITKLLEENKRLKDENKKMLFKVDSYELYGDQHEEEYNQAFNQGAEAAWELVRKIFDMETNDIEDIFIKEDAWNLGTVLNNYTYQEAAAKVAEWEKAKEEIKVGDVLENMAFSKIKCVVTNLYPDNMAYSIFGDGTAGMHELNNFKKTGRHIDIDSFLKQIGGEQK